MLVLGMTALIAALVVATTVPALARNGHPFDRFNSNESPFSQEVAQDSQSGDFQTNFSVENTGDYAFQCTPAVQFGNTGNFNNAPSFLQHGSTADDFQPGGIDVTFAPEQETDCSNTIQQSSAASG